jgi:YidC/Oxa1 family membrane protein insertase
MGNLRPVLLITIVMLGYMLWVEWQKDYGPKPAPPPSTPMIQPSGQPQGDTPAIPDFDAGAARTAPTTGDLPTPQQDLPGAAEQEPAAPQAVMKAEKETISVTTDVLHVKIDPVGGTVVSARLLEYPVELDDPDRKVDLLTPYGDGLFIAQSGLLSHQPAPNHGSEYHSDQDSYTLARGGDEIRVPLTWSSPDGIHVTKTFVFKEGQYDIEVRHLVENESSLNWSGSRYDQLQRSVADDEGGGGFNDPERYSFNGIGFYNPESKFEKIDFDDVVDDPYSLTTAGGWLSMIQHYFFAAWIPPEAEVVTYSTQEIKPNGWPRYIARNVSSISDAAPGSRTEFTSRLYVGPKLQERLPDIAPGLEHTVNYGIFTVFSKPLFWLLQKIHSVVGNWGWSIVLLTVLIKAAFFKLSEAQYRSMARMKKLQPRVEQLKERYGDDKQRMSQEMMALYKKEKANPLGGCLPILVQIPIFIALYWVLIESVELRQAPFILWIENLSERDPYFILPALNAIFMIATQRLSPATGMDPLQQKMMQFMPIIFRHVRVLSGWPRPVLGHQRRFVPGAAVLHHPQDYPGYLVMARPGQHPGAHRATALQYYLGVTRHGCHVAATGFCAAH